MKFRLLYLLIFSIVCSSSYFEFNPSQNGILDLGNLFNYANQWYPEKAENRWNKDNPVTDKGATLGRVLFYDKELSVNNTTACASCHQQENAFGDTRKVSIGFNGQPTMRHAMRLVNVDFHADQMRFWDERVRSLETLSTLPIQDTIEMGFSGKNGFPAIDSLLRKMNHLDYYPKLFKEVYGDSVITEKRIGLALAQFIRSIITFDSRFDEGFNTVGEEITNFPNFTEEENRGKRLFFQPPFGIVGDSDRKGAACGFCHKAPSGDIIHLLIGNNGIIGVANDSTAVDLSVKRSPSLKNLVKPDGTTNGPFMHDGSLATLEEVVDHYNFIPFNPQNPNQDGLLFPLDNGNVELRLTDEEKSDVVAFLKTLAGEDLYTNEKWSNPFDANGNIKLTNSLICNTEVNEMAITICDGSSFEGFTQAGIYTDTFSISDLCDSIRILDLTVFPTPTTSETVQICEGKNYNGWTESGMYEIRKQATSGCDTIHTVLLEVLEASSSTCLSTSTNNIELASAEPSIYPNPTCNIITFRNVPTDRYTLSILNNKGSVVQEKVVNIIEGNPLPISWLPSGMYFIHLLSEDDSKSYPFKILKVE